MKSESETRKNWKDEWSQKYYGKSYIALCSDKKRVVDQLYLVSKMELEEKAKK